MKKITGRTYSLPQDNSYYLYIAKQIDLLLAQIGNLASLDKTLSKLILDKETLQEHRAFEIFFSQISLYLLKHYTPRLPAFTASITSDHSDHEIFRLSAREYHLRMLHIEVLNRLMRNGFLQAANKVIILPHCLRDFRADECQFQPGDVDYICMGCSEKCQINQTKIFLENHPGYHLYISQNQDLDKVFKLARKIHKNVALLGVACIPELYEGMILARKMGTPAQGILLNYNRCSRWMKNAQYTNFNFEQLTKIISLN